MEVVCPAETLMINPSSEIYKGSNTIPSLSMSETSATTARAFSSEHSVNQPSMQNQKEHIIHKPLKAINNGPIFVSNVATLQKSQYVLKQRTSVSSASTLHDKKPTVETAGIKRPLISSDRNVITKVIITKSPHTGQTLAYTVGSPSFALASLPEIDNLTFGINQNQQQNCSSATQLMALTSSATFTSQGTLLPVKTQITNSFNACPPKMNVPFLKVPITMTTTPAPVSEPLNKQSLTSNMAVLSQTSNAVSSADNVLGKLGASPKVMIRQASTPTGLPSFTLKGLPVSTLTPQSVKTYHAIQALRTPLVTQNVQPVTADSSGSVQQLHISGNQFHYVQLVSPANSGETKIPEVSDIRKTAEAVQTTTPVQNAGQVQITFQPQNAPLASKPATKAVSVNKQPGVHHIILPATSMPTTVPGSSVTTLVPIQPASSVPVTAAQKLNQLPRGTAILPATNSTIPGLQSFALVPASYVTQLQQQLSGPQVTQATPVPSAPRQTRDYVPIASLDPAISQYTASRNGENHTGPTLEATGARPRKPCNCNKSQCLKLYCDCFANGEFCQNCNCSNCSNNLENEEERSKAIKSCLDRNPQAFHPKIGKSREVEGSRQHSKGCNCKRSGCLKNYCECYEAKIMCSHYCKCIGCKNFEESSERRTLMHLADAAEVRVQQQTAAKTKLSSQISSVPLRPPVATANGERLPFALITADVAEATSACLLAQAEEAERMKMPPVVQERMIIEEFGRCLMQIIESANRTRTAGSLA